MRRFSVLLGAVCALNVASTVSAQGPDIAEMRGMDGVGASGAAIRGARDTTAAASGSAAPAKVISEESWTPWKDLFDGKSLNGWRQQKKGGFSSRGLGNVQVENGRIELSHDTSIVGIAATQAVPNTNYEVEVEEMRVSGGQFAHMLFPVGDSFLALCAQNFGGNDESVGLGTVDGKHFEANETTRHLNLDTGRWYVVKLRVLDDRIQVWIDGRQQIELPRKGHEFSAGRLAASREGALGLFTGSSKAAIRSVRIRQLKPGIVANNGSPARDDRNGLLSPTSQPKASEVLAPDGSPAPVSRADVPFALPAMGPRALVDMLAIIPGLVS